MSQELISIIWRWVHKNWRDRKQAGLAARFPDKSHSTKQIVPGAKSPLGKQGQKQEAQLQAPCKWAARKLGGESWSTRHRLEIPASSSRHNAKQISQRHEVTSPLLFLDIIKLLTSMQSHRNTSAQLNARTPAGIAGMLIQRGEDLGFFY